MKYNSEFKSLTGLAFFEMVRDGAIESGMAETMGMKVMEVSDGKSVLRVVPTDRFNNHFGLIHGGYAATVLDSAMGVAVHSKLPKELTAVTIDLKVTYVKAIRSENGLLLAQGRVLHAGRTLLAAAGELVDESGKLYVHATASFLTQPK
jgi:uncharacterized protein (TIGR00369 family)